MSEPKPNCFGGYDFVAFDEIKDVPEFHVAVDRYLMGPWGLKMIEAHSSICGKWDANGSPVEE